MKASSFELDSNGRKPVFVISFVICRWYNASVYAVSGKTIAVKILAHTMSTIIRARIFLLSSQNFAVSENSIFAPFGKAFLRGFTVSF